jgi:hypothetical protein
VAPPEWGLGLRLSLVITSGTRDSRSFGTLCASLAEEEVEEAEAAQAGMVGGGAGRGAEEFGFED